MSAPKALLCILALTVSGCSLAPRYTQPCLPTAEQYPGLTDDETSFDVGQLTWCEFFEDTDLHELICQALENNRDLRIAVSRVEEAQALHGIQRAGLWPTISADSGFSRSRVPSDVSPTGTTLAMSQYRAGVSLSNWELDLWGRIRNLKDAALQSYLSTEQARRAVVSTLISEVAHKYLVASELVERIDIAMQTVASREESHRIAMRRYEEGAEPKLDAIQAESLLNQARADLAALERLEDLNRNTLVLLVGAPITTDIRPLSKIEEGFLKDIPAGLPSDLLANRPDVLAAEHRLRAAHADIGAARAAFFPRITLMGAFGTASSELEGLFGAGSQAWTFAPSLSLPIFTGGRNRSNLCLAKARRNLAVADYERTIQIAFREVADALAERRWISEELTAQEATVAAQRERVRLATLKYDNGVAPYLEVLDSERERFIAEQELVLTRRTLIASWVSLYTALGGGGTE